MQSNVLKRHSFLLKVCFILIFSFSLSFSATLHAKQPIKALYIPLADHYAALVAYERYREQMKYANFEILKMKNWDLLRAYFQSGKADMAYVMSPLAMDMYSKQPNFKWIGLMHRDGNALAINKLIKDNIDLPKKRINRKPDKQVAYALQALHQSRKKSTQIAMPHLLSTHSVVLYKYLKNYGIELTLTKNNKIPVEAIAIAPPKAPAFIKGQSNRATPAAFEQSLPWADVVETGGFGYIAWYSKDVLPWENGHVECIALATDLAIKNKYLATKEVMDFIKIAGTDIEQARKIGGRALDEIVIIVQKHIPEHTRDAIIASLDPDLRVINYQSLNIDEAGLKLIMNLALEADILKKSIDIELFSDHRFDN
ncbi:ABC transporter substrate-binding protein [Psychromonas hadalis]|uniref:ABC transporter substrate-binding protein n=1 Tax=Psychromonas hadalis TaxID=211669 RepID=UPI0003B6D236|nr:ABC transporter substrate-binding protein [Psychromonas hadalis]